MIEIIKREDVKSYANVYYHLHYNYTDIGDKEKKEGSKVIFFALFSFYKQELNIRELKGYLLEYKSIITDNDYAVKELDKLITYIRGV